MTKMEAFIRKAAGRNVQNLHSPRLIKSFNGSGMQKDAMALSSVSARFPQAVPSLQQGCTENTTLLMTDLSPFSSFVANLPAEDIKLFLHEYYKYVVEIINQRGGIVEKYIGDAVIAVFGSPFSKTYGIVEACQAAMEITARTYQEFGGELASKTSLVKGKCFFGYVGHSTHEELTIIGNPLTYLFRLESICEPNSIVMESNLFQQIANSIFQPSNGTGPRWTVPSPTSVSLKGMPLNLSVQSIRYVE